MHALITGACGQDGILLARRLSASGDEVTGLIKPGTDTSSLLRYAPNVRVVECDLANVDALARVVSQARPDEIYNLAGVSSIVDSWNEPELTHRVNVDAVAVLIQAASSLPTPARLLEASSGAIFEGVTVAPQNEDTAPVPISPYAKSKAAAMTVVREARMRGLHAVSAILYNHESPLRGANFVTRRISQQVARIGAGLATTVELGSLDVRRDWGWAPDYVDGMLRMMRAPAADDFILATGHVHQLEQFLASAFAAIGIEDWRPLVVSRPDLQRTVDPSVLCGDASAAYRTLGWTHTKAFGEIAGAMVAYDAELLDDPGALWWPT